MSRFRAVAANELSQTLRRPLIWIWIGILALLAWGLSTGHVRIQSGDSTVGGTKAHITSEFAVAQTISMLVPLFYGFFVAVAAGMSMIRDHELRVGDVLHSTPLKAREYVWGKFSSLLLVFLGILALHLGLSALFNHVGSKGDGEEFIGPFHALNYLRPALVFGLPTILFLAGTSFAIGETTRKPILVFLLPVALLVFCLFFVWFWTPTWLDPRIDRALMLADPTGFRWLNETWLKIDRGVDFYNTAHAAVDGPFVLTRLGYSLVGLLAVAWSAASFTRRMRGKPGMPRRRLFRRAPRALRPSPERAATPLAGLRMVSRRPGSLLSALRIARIETRELRSQPGLYLFVPLIVLEAVANGALATGAFDTPLLVTSGVLAVRSMGWLTTLVALLLLFYQVESLRREESTRAGSIVHATPVSTGALLAGKTLANALVGGVVLGVALASCWGVMVYQEVVPFELAPFLIVWGLLLVPTLLAWCAFVTALFALTRSRYGTYGLALGAMGFTMYHFVTGGVEWAWNWPLWSALTWSDFGLFELDRAALTWNRVAVLGAGLLFAVLTLRTFPRRQPDGTRALWRLRPRALLRHALRLSPFAAVPLLACGVMLVEVGDGFQDVRARKLAKDYWRKNDATWKDAPVPDIARADVDLELDPAERWLRVDGRFALVNLNEEPLERLPLSIGSHWEETAWTLDGDPIAPEDRAGLVVVELTSPLGTGEQVTVGFRHHGRFPSGWTKNGGTGVPEFILPAGVVLTSFRPTFVPVVGYREGVGPDSEDRPEPKEWADDFYEGLTRSFVGAARPFPVRLRITAPEEYTMNGVGELVEEKTADGLRTVVWASEEPVQFFNVVGGRWDVARGDGVAVFHHPKHTYNVDLIVSTLEAALTYYSEWFHPYPYGPLKLSEFPGYASYAQGFASNIPFTENVGFLTENDPRTNAAFFVTAHESAHQWWGNLLSPGEGPGGNILSEGMAHFSTILLFEAVLGERERIEFCKRIEESYGDKRQEDSERPLVKIDGSRPGDGTVQYDKGGWVAWMLTQHLGRDAMLDGLRSFVAHYRDALDHPVLHDLVAHLREYASDVEAYDAFTRQWFFEVHVPQYSLVDATWTAEPDGTWSVRATLRNDGTGRMPVTVAAERGVRFPGEPGEDPRAVLAAQPGEPAALPADLEDEPEPFHDARTTVELGAGESVELSWTCAFEPERLVVDPDVLVLQLYRDKAVYGF